MIFDKGKQIHKVYCPIENGFQLLFGTKDYYKIKNELERFEN